MSRFKCPGTCVRDSVIYCEMCEEIEEVVVDEEGNEKVIKNYQCNLEEEDY